MLHNVFYAGGTKGPTARADGKGGFLARGWYARRFGQVKGPFSTQKKAEAYLNSTPTPQDLEPRK